MKLLIDYILMELLVKFRPKVESFEVCQAPGAFTYVFRAKINLQDLEELSSLVKSLEGVIKFPVE